MATRTIGTDKRWRAEFVALLLVLAIAASVLAVQARSLLSTTSNNAVRLPRVIVLKELPTGPQHSQGPHPYKISHLAQPSAEG